MRGIDGTRIHRSRGPERGARLTAAVAWASLLAIGLSLTAGCTAHDSEARRAALAADEAEAAVALSDAGLGSWVADDDVLGSGTRASGARAPTTPAANPRASVGGGHVADSALPPQRHERPFDSLHSEWTPAPIAADGSDGATLYPLANGTFASAPIENHDPGIGSEAARRSAVTNPLGEAIAARAGASATTALDGSPLSAPSTDAASDLMPTPNGAVEDATLIAAPSDALQPSDAGVSEARTRAWDVAYEPRGIVITVEEGLFTTGRASPAASGARTMDEIAAFLARYPGRAVIVESHTDSAGPAPANMQLSRKRAEVVRAGLIARGVPSHDIEARPYGESYPAASNASDEGRRRNDRVELVLVPPGQSGEASYREMYEASAGDLSPY